MIEVKSPITPKEWDDYYNLRFEILRKPLDQPKGSERNEGDLTGNHFAIYENTLLKAIGRLDTVDKTTSQVRFFCTAISSQGKGYGKILMEFMEDFSQQQGNNKMILQARENAVDFYSKLGYKVLNKSHLLYNKVQHYLMEKKY